MLKKLRAFGLAVALALLEPLHNFFMRHCVLRMADVTYGPKVYHDQGGDKMTVKDQGVVDFEGGNGLKISGTDRTAALATAPAAVAAGYKVARGQLSTASAADTVATGLATVVSVVASFEDDVDGVTISQVTAQVGNQAGAPAAGSVVIKTWKATSAANPTLIAATTFTKKVNWVAIGT